MNCKDFENLYWQRTYGESIPGGEDGFLDHLESCPTCAERKVELDRLQALLAARRTAEPKQEALNIARQRLAARIKVQSGQSPFPRLGDRWFEWIKPWFQPVWKPAIALGLLLVGLILGRMIYYSPGDLLNQMPQIDLTSSMDFERQYITDNVLKSGSNIQDFRIKPLAPESGLVQVNFKAVQDYQIQGDPTDALIENLLTWALKNDANSGSRLSSVEELARASDLSTPAQEALAYALVNDQNAGVRLKALEALGSAPRNSLSEQAILSALLKDSNPAVRIRAIDMILSEELDIKSEPLILKAAEADSNDYVRMRAREAFRQTNYNYELVNDHE